MENQTTESDLIRVKFGSSAFLCFLNKSITGEIMKSELEKSSLSKVMAIWLLLLATPAIAIEDRRFGAPLEIKEVILDFDQNRMVISGYNFDRGHGSLVQVNLGDRPHNG